MGPLPVGSQGNGLDWVLFWEGRRHPLTLAPGEAETSIPIPVRMTGLAGTRAFPANGMLLGISNASSLHSSLVPFASRSSLQTPSLNSANLRLWIFLPLSVAGILQLRDAGAHIDPIASGALGPGRARYAKAPEMQIMATTTKHLWCVSHLHR